MSYSTTQRAYTYQEGHPHHDPEVNAAVKEHEAKFGGYNDVPPGWREITEAEFVKGPFFSQCVEKTEFRQLVHAEIKGERGWWLINAHLYFFHDGTGVALMDDNLAGKLRFFAFGCDHKYREVHGNELQELGFKGLMGGCDHALYCDKCKHKMVVDSSD